MKLSVLIASYGPQSQKFIDLAYKSLEAQTFKDFEVIHVSSGDFKPNVPIGNHIHNFDRLHYPSAISHAYQYSDKSSEYIFLMNDDVILHKDCLKNMIEISEKSDILVNPMSSCQNGRWYQAPLGFQDKDGNTFLYQKNQYLYEEMAPYAEDIIERSIVHSAMFFYTEWVAFFGTMMRRATYDRIGGICTDFQTGADDLDFSIRAKKIGIQCGIITNASLLHFSGISANLHLSQESRNFNKELFKERHGRDI